MFLRRLHHFWCVTENPSYIVYINGFHQVYIRDFWIGRANCPLFAEQVLLSAESLSLGLPIFLHDNLTQQWGVPPEHRSSAEVSVPFLLNSLYSHLI